MGRQKDKSVPPDWFRLEKYDAAHGLDLWGWYVNLQKRRDLYFRRDAPTEGKIRLRENPIIEPPPPPLWSGKAVRPASERDYFLIETPATTPKDFLEVFDPKEPLDCPLKSQGLPLLAVDLRHDDDLIIKEFSAWLKAQRKPSKFSEQDRTNWANWRVLPYIDLIMAGNDVPFPTLARGDGDEMVDGQPLPGFLNCGQETIRKNTRPTAKWLLEEETLATMRTEIFNWRGL